MARSITEEAVIDEELANMQARKFQKRTDANFLGGMGFTAIWIGTGTDGSRLKFYVVMHMTVNAQGTVTTQFRTSRVSEKTRKETDLAYDVVRGDQDCPSRCNVSFGKSQGNRKEH